jgi:hypothetical protein
MTNVQTETGSTKKLLLDRPAIDELRRLVCEGWVRTVVVRDRTGRELIRMPILVGLAAGALAPIWAALGAVADLALGCTVEVQLAQETEPATWPPEPPPDVDEEG